MPSTLKELYVKPLLTHVAPRRQRRGAAVRAEDATLSGLMTIPDHPQGRTVPGRGTGRFYPGLKRSNPFGIGGKGSLRRRSRVAFRAAVPLDFCAKINCKMHRIRGKSLRLQSMNLLDSRRARHSVRAGTSESRSGAHRLTHPAFACDCAVGPRSHNSFDHTRSSRRASRSRGAARQWREQPARD